MREIFSTPGEGRVLLGYLKHTIWTLACDLEVGTTSEVYDSEAKLRLGWLDKLAEHDPADAPEEIGTEEWREFVDDNTKDSMDTFYWNEEVLEIPIYGVDS